MTTIMRGNTLLRGYVNSFFESALPPVIQVARDQWGVSEIELPEPEMYDAVDPSVVDRYPALGSVILNDRNHVREDWDTHGQQVYSAVYSVRVMVVARTPHTPEGRWLQPEKEQAIRLRDDLTRLVHHVVLDKPSMGHPDVIRCNEGAMLTDYLEPFMANSQSKRWIAASVVTLEVAFTESTYLTPIGSADTINVEVTKLIP